MAGVTPYLPGSYLAGSLMDRAQWKAILRLAQESNAFFDIKRGVRTNLTSEFTEPFRLVDVAENFRRFPAFTVADD